MMKTVRLRGVAALALLLAGCGPDFDPYTRLTKLRVLAVASDPPSPAAGETTTLTPLVYTPDPTTPLSYAWSWCPVPGPASQGYPCLVSEADLSQGGVAVPPYDLGSAPTATFKHTVDPQILQRLCAGIPGSMDKPDCENGFPVQVRVVVSAGSEQVDTVYTLNLRFDPATPPNQNPHLPGLSAEQDGEQKPIGDSPEVILPRKVDTRIHADVPEEDAERYQGLDSAGNPGTVRERLTLSWFVESGDPHDGRTGFIDGVTTFAAALTNRWKPASEKDYPGDTARIIVVVRDNRGGVAWRGGVVRLGAAP